MPFVMVTNAHGYRGLEGKGVQVGGSVPMVSVDYVGLLDADGESILYNGIAVGYGASSPDVHITWGETCTWFSSEFDWVLFYKLTTY